MFDTAHQGDAAFARLLSSSLKVMQEKRERWMELAALAADEQDPDKLVQLVAEMDAILEAKEKRLRALRTGKSEEGC